MFSLQIDTARTWRGGQNQVLLTALGPARARPPGRARRAPGRRAAAARRGGRRGPAAGARRRDGLPRRRGGCRACSATWRPTSCTPTIRTRWPWPPLALSIGAPAPAPGARRLAPRRLPPQAATRSRAGSTGRSTASSPRRRPFGRCSSRTASRRERIFTVHEGIDVERVAAVAPANVRAEFWLPTHCAGRRQHRRARAAQGTAVPDRRRAASSCARCRTRGSSSSARASCGRRSSTRSATSTSRSTSSSPGSGTDVLGLLKGFDLFVMSSVTEGLGTSLLDAMAAAPPDRRDDGRRHPRSRRRRRDGPARAAARRARAGGRDRGAAARPGRAGADGPRPGLRGCASGSASSGWSTGRWPCTSAWPAAAGRSRPQNP